MSDNKYQIVVKQSGLRLDKFIHSQYPNFTRSYIQNLILKGNILINNTSVKTGYKIKTEGCWLGVEYMEIVLEKISENHKSVDFNLNEPTYNPVLVKHVKVNVVDEV